MLTEDGKHLYVSYDEYHNLIEKLAIKVHQSGWQFDTILCLARGGMRPGDVLSRIFDKPLAIMSTSSYRADAGTVQGHLDIARYITTPKGEIAGKVLLVDDLADSGHTLHAVVRNAARPATSPHHRAAQRAVVWTKASVDLHARTARSSSCRPTPGSSPAPSRATTRCGAELLGQVVSLTWRFRPG